MQQSCVKVFTGYAVLLLRNFFHANVLVYIRCSLALSECEQNFHVEVHNICAAAAVFDQARLCFRHIMCKFISRLSSCCITGRDAYHALPVEKRRSACAAVLKK